MEPARKLLDGVWFGVDGQWVGPATKFSSGFGYTRFEPPAPSGLRLTRTDFGSGEERGASCRTGNPGLFHTGCGGGADGKGDFEIFSLTTSIQAIAEGNYGRLGRGQQQRYTDANAETMFSEPATSGTPDEQPGAMPEIFPSTPTGDPAQGIPANINRCWTCRSMFMQAWATTGRRGR